MVRYWAPKTYIYISNLKPWNSKEDDRSTVLKGEVLGTKNICNISNLKPRNRKEDDGRTVLKGEVLGAKNIYIYF